MARLSEQVTALKQLIETGQTLDAMDRFYADDVTMPNAARQENEQPPRIGKTVCMAHERQMLAGVTSFKAILLSQAINEETGVVFSEWQYESTDVSNRHFLLTEVSVQHWRTNLIYQEKFYYSKPVRIDLA